MGSKSEAEQNGYADRILALAQTLPFPDAAAERFRYGARSEAAVFVGDLLREEVPSLADEGGTLEIVAIARRPGVLSKVVIRARGGEVLAYTHPSPQPSPRGRGGIGADHLARVSRRLDGERIHVIAWQRSARAYIADALGLGEVPPMLLLPAIAHARVLLGDIDVRGIAGWRDLNVVLASALTGWRIRLEPVAATAAWRRLELAMRTRRPVPGTVVGATERGPRLELLGLYAVLSGGDSRRAVEGQELQVRITRMDADESRIFATDRLLPDGQLPLI